MYISCVCTHIYRENIFICTKQLNKYDSYTYRMVRYAGTPWYGTVQYGTASKKLAKETEMQDDTRLVRKALQGRCQKSVNWRGAIETAMGSWWYWQSSAQTAGSAESRCHEHAHRRPQAVGERRLPREARQVPSVRQWAPRPCRSSRAGCVRQMREGELPALS